tara:strand:+ start:24 stop:1241 length:1218 start_codon:yes stop_codon:yes gene_type:complete
MISFKKYYAAHRLLTEAKANTHLTHLEELVLTQGERGYGVARGFITDLLSHLQGKSKRKVNTSVKWDGAPAIFAGKHPETGKFFVGTKSIFNKDPKINYTDADVEMNHGHAPGLADKLKKALKYLPKLGIKGILQGDFMFDSSSLQPMMEDGVKHITFKPNTIRYAVEADTEFGKEIGNSVFGIVFHTGYSDLNSPPQYNISVKGLNKVPGVWVDDAVFTDTTGTVTLDVDEAKQVKDLLKTADKIKVNYKDLPSDLLNIYTNSEIQQGKYLEDSEMSFKKFIEWFKGRKEKQVAKLKSQAGKKRAIEAFNKKLAEIKAQEKDIVNIFKVSRLLSQAKQIFVNKYNNAVYNTKHFLDNEDGTLKATAPEGYVAVSRAGDAVKLVDRLEFSRANFSGGQSSTPITK